MFQSEVILKNPIHIILIAIPLIIQTFLIFGIAYVACYLLKLPHNIAAPAGMIGASNFFELAVAVAIALFGTTSEAALAIIDGTGPLSTDGIWGNHMQFTSKAIGELGAINGPRCCKRDAMIAFKIAEAFGRHLASDVFQSYSAGTETKPQINQDAVRIMKELYNIDMETDGQFSKLVSDIPNPDIAISMGCNVGCPFIGRPFDDNWGLEDPTGKSDEEFKIVIEKIRKDILKLKNGLDKR